RGQTLLVFCTMVEAADGPPGFGFRVVGRAIATYDLPGLTFAGFTPLPFTEPRGVSWGTGAVLVGDIVYVYGAAAGDEYVARVAFERATTGPGAVCICTGGRTRDAIGAVAFEGGPPEGP